MNLAAVLAALQGKQWVLLAALLVGAVVALAKQGWLSVWLAAKLPKAALPWLAVTLGVLGLSSAEIAAGTPWPKAVMDGLSSGLAAVFAHQTIVEGVRKGVEIVPPKDEGAKKVG